MTAREIVESIKKNLGVPWNEQTYRDTFKIGEGGGGPGAVRPTGFVTGPQSPTVVNVFRRAGA